MASVTRRSVLIGGGGAVAAVGVASLGVSLYRRANPPSAPIGFAVSPEQLAAARDLMARHPSIDAHAHPGRTFVDGAQNLSGLMWIYAHLGHFEDQAVRDMREGGLSAAVFAAVSDFQTLGPQGEGLVTVRAFEPGEAWASYQRQIAHLKALSQRGLVFPVLSVEDIEAARRAGKPGALLSVEGGDFLEGKPERVAQAFSDGVRSITLMHYRNNELGDTITGEAVHGGLSAAGSAVVKAMNATGMLVDVAHASEATVRGVLRATSKPLIASHVHLQTRGLSHPRFISPNLARSVAAQGGGVVGAWPAGIGISDLEGFVHRTRELIEVVGIDHVCLGTDMDANYKPVLDNYTKLPLYVAGLQQQGLREEDIAKLIGGNVMRLLAAQAA
ncbi:MAG: membrane dipeptidase [Burkholderiaceae bacterium]